MFALKIHGSKIFPTLSSSHAQLVHLLCVDAEFCSAALLNTPVNVKWSDYNTGWPGKPWNRFCLLVKLPMMTVVPVNARQFKLQWLLQTMILWHSDVHGEGGRDNCLTVVEVSQKLCALHFFEIYVLVICSV